MVSLQLRLSWRRATACHTAKSGSDGSIAAASADDAACQLRLLLYSGVVVSGRGRRHRAPEGRPADPPVALEQRAGPVRALVLERELDVQRLVGRVQPGAADRPADQLVEGDRVGPVRGRELLLGVRLGDRGQQRPRHLPANPAPADNVMTALLSEVVMFGAQVLVTV